MTAPNASAARADPGTAAAPTPALHAGGSTYALLTDGSTIEIRPAWPQDMAAVR